jgi:hypothetical protein
LEKNAKRRRRSRGGRTVFMVIEKAAGERVFAAAKPGDSNTTTEIT